MAEEDDASKTEDPTSKRLEKAREKGQVSISQEVKNWVVLFGGFFSLLFLAPFMMAGVREAVRTFVEAPHTVPFDFEHLRFMVADLLIDIAVITGPIIALMFFLAIVATTSQVGLIWAPAKLKLNFGKLSLTKGFKRMFGVNSLVELLKGLLKLVVVSIVGFGLSLPLLADITLLPHVSLADTLHRVHIVALWLVAGTLAVMTVIAVIDFTFQKFQFTKQMRMTKQEVKDEHKQAEGDPQVRARIRRIRMERAMQRMFQAIPKADVVITNPTHYAVALEYKMEAMSAPRLIAKGIDLVAVRIRQVAEENDVPVVENPPLARVLYATVELDQEVPPQHYQAVAEVIGYVMRLRGEMPTHRAETGP